MRKKLLGIALCIVGIAGLISALIFVSVTGNPKHLSLLLAGGIIGAFAFFMGLRMIPGAGKITGKTLKINIVPTARPVEQGI